MNHLCMLRFLLKTDPTIQDLSLQALAMWKMPYLMPYKERCAAVLRCT